MKSSRMTPAARAERREIIMSKRQRTLDMHRARGRSYVQSRTTRFDKHSSDRQRARYARQTGYVQPQPVAPTKPKRTPLIRKTARKPG